MSGQMHTARALIALLHKEDTANDAAVGLDNIVYRGDALIKTAILAELAAKPLPTELRTPSLELLLKRLRVFAAERLKAVGNAEGGESLKPASERVDSLRTVINHAAVVGVEETELERARKQLPALEWAAMAAERERAAALRPEDLATPAELICPISGEMMAEPVVASDGKTYDRKSIEKVLAGPAEARLSPVTNAPLQPTLHLNVALTQRLEAHCEQLKRVAALSEPAEPAVPDFEAAPSFAGQRLGTSFKLGERGLGYYRDAAQLQRLQSGAQSAARPLPPRMGPTAAELEAEAALEAAAAQRGEKRKASAQ